jgi:selenocysteine lyase/cysteine desulfurase
LRTHIAQDALTQNSSNHNNNHSSKARLTTFTSPFELPGQQHQPITLPMVYCDQTASNRPLQSIEKYLQDKCWPLYGNTHTNTSITGSQSTAFVAEARQLVAEAVNAKTTGKASLDLVLFA